MIPTNKCFGVGLLLWAMASFAHSRSDAVETVKLAADAPANQLVGRVLVEAADGGLLLETSDSALHLLEPKMIATRQADEQPFVLDNRKQLAKRLLEELPPGFQVYHSKHYVIAYNTTLTYAKWCSSLLERLQKAFLGYWERLDAETTPPAQPLVVLIFGDKRSFARYAKDELGASVNSVIGYYSITSNRVAMYDLTGDQAALRRNGSRGSSRDITLALSTPAAVPLVATIIHEATHQIAFNSGLQTRLVDNPRWLSEGLAVYFETPDLSNSRGWGGMGKVNPTRWAQFRADYRAGKTIPLADLITDDTLLANSQTAISAYASAWAWNYFLIRHYPKEFVAYLAATAAQPRLVWDSKEERLDKFQQHFGKDLDTLTAEFYRSMSRLD